MISVVLVLQVKKWEKHQRLIYQTFRIRKRKNIYEYVWFNKIIIILYKHDESLCFSSSYIGSNKLKHIGYCNC